MSDINSNTYQAYGCNPPDLLQESLGPFGPEVFRECPSGCFWGPSGPENTPRDTPGTLRARRARETPVAGRGGCKHMGPEEVSETPRRP